MGYLIASKLATLATLASVKNLLGSIDTIVKTAKDTVYVRLGNATSDQKRKQQKAAKKL